MNGCALFHKRKKPRPSAAVQPQMVGTIALVNDSMHFVLVDTGGSAGPQKGQALKSFTNGQESGILMVTGERQRPFIAADIVKGAPQKGDEVMQ